MKLYNNIKTSTNKSEITIAIFADYSKAFNIIDFYTLIQKIDIFNFSKVFLYWTMNYLTFQQHFVQTDAHFSTLLTSNSEYHKTLYYKQYYSIYVSQICLKWHQKANVYNTQVIPHYMEHAKQVKDMHVSTVLRKIPILFWDGPETQILFLTVPKQKLWSYRLHKCLNIANLKKKKKLKMQQYHSRKSLRIEINWYYTW